MKKFTSTALGGAPVNDDDLLDIFNSEIWAAIQALLSPYDADTQGIVVSGCVTTANSSNFDMTAGIVYLNGEFMRVAAVTNQSFTKYIAPSTPVNDSRTFQDLSVNVVAVTKGAGLVGSAPGSGQYLSIASLTDLDDRRWNPLTRAQLALKADVTQPAWTNIPLQNGWAAAAGLGTPQYRLDTLGRLWLRGQLDGTSATSDNITNTGALPGNGYNVQLPTVRVHASTLVYDAKIISVQTSGQMISTDHANSLVLTLDGLSYS